jgi:hypothetical protein
MWFSILFGLFLTLVAAMMVIRNVRIWKCLQTMEMNDRERDFFGRQFWRRLQANGLIAIVGVAIIIGLWVTDSVTAAVYWLFVVLLVPQLSIEVT